MHFIDAHKIMKAGHRIKLPEWKEYWAWENDETMVHYNDGSIVNVWDVGDEYFIKCGIRIDWITDVEHPEEFPQDGHTTKATIGFEDALRHLKSGKTLSRISWDDKIRVRANMMIPAIMYYKNIGGTWMMCGAHTVTDADIFGNDWYIV